jgi:acetaldehyde dehydrogenase (acetylating)
VAVTYAADEAAGPQMGAGGAPRVAPPGGRNFEEALTQTAAKAVKGVGHVTKGRPLDDAADGAAIFTKSHDAIMRTKAATVQGTHDSDSVLGALSNDFAMHPQFAPMAYRLKSDGEIRKNFTAQNLGGSGAPYGLVPFDLSAPSRLVYPVYTLFR